MKTKILSLFLFLFFIFTSYSETVLLAPFVMYNSENNRESASVSPNKSVGEELSRYWFNGLIDFRVLSEKEYGAISSVLDAERVCNATKSVYVIYGYVRRNENSWYGELKLYDSENKKIESEFFASDNSASYDRLIRTLADRIREYFNSMIGIDENSLAVQDLRPFEVRIPFKLSYWSPMNKDWLDVLLGTGAFDIALDFYPEIKHNVFRNMKYDFSLRLDFGYKFGIGNPSAYTAQYHALSMFTPMMSHLYFSEKHSLYLGLGLIYEFDILTLTKKYESPSNHIQNQFGGGLLFGYQFEINDRWNFFTEIETDLYITERSFNVIKPGFGFSYRISKEAKK